MPALHRELATALSMPYLQPDEAVVVEPPAPEPEPLEAGELPVLPLPEVPLESVVLPLPLVPLEATVEPPPELPEVVPLLVPELPLPDVPPPLLAALPMVLVSPDVPDEPEVPEPELPTVLELLPDVDPPLEAELPDVPAHGSVEPVLLDVCAKRDPAPASADAVIRRPSAFVVAFNLELLDVLRDTAARPHRQAIHVALRLRTPFTTR